MDEGRGTIVKKIGIVGCGAMGSTIAKAIVSDFKKQARLAALYDIDSGKSQKLGNILNKKNIVVSGLMDLIKKSDLVIESAHSNSSRDIALKAIKKKRDCLIMSVGGLIDAQDVLALAKRKGCKVYIPSGAICGIDGLKAHKMAGIKKVILTTRKPPLALKGAPYITENKIDLEKINQETLIFEGTAADAVLAFPQNTNVAATLSLAGIGKDKTYVRIVSSPEYSGNTHEIQIESDAGSTFIRCENSPSPDNPKTSYLAILSAIATLKGILDPVKIGA